MSVTESGNKYGNKSVFGENFFNSPTLILICSSTISIGSTSHDLFLLQELWLVHPHGSDVRILKHKSSIFNDFILLFFVVDGGLECWRGWRRSNEVGGSDSFDRRAATPQPLCLGRQQPSASANTHCDCTSQPYWLCIKSCHSFFFFFFLEQLWLHVSELLALPPPLLWRLQFAESLSQFTDGSFRGNKAVINRPHKGKPAIKWRSTLAEVSWSFSSWRSLVRWSLLLPACLRRGCTLDFILPSKGSECVNC